MKILIYGVGGVGGFIGSHLTEYFIKRGSKIFLEAANSAYEPIELDLDQVVFQGKLLAVWRNL